MKIIGLAKRQSLLTGFDPWTFVRSLRELPAFLYDLRKYQKMSDSLSFQIRLSDVFPILSDREDKAGAVGGHYFHQDLWAATKIFQRRPAQHIDIGSRIDGFVAHLLVFMPVTVVDIRPLANDLARLSFCQDDATELKQFADDSVDSISSLHAAEHFGLGRYSDPVDPKACFRFMSSLQRVLSPGGRLYFSVPISSRERVEFNAHRVFAPTTVLNSFSGLELVSFSFVGDDGRIYENTHPRELPQSAMACGLFEFTKA